MRSPSRGELRRFFAVTPALVISILMGLCLAGGIIGITRLSVWNTVAFSDATTTVTVASPDGRWRARTLTDDVLELSQVSVRERDAGSWRIVYAGPLATASWSGRHQLVILELSTETRHVLDAASAPGDVLGLRTPSLSWVIPVAVALFLACMGIGLWLGWLSRRTRESPRGTLLLTKAAAVGEGATLELTEPAEQPTAPNEGAAPPQA